MIRLVEHADLDVAEVAVALLDQVGQPAGAGDDDVGRARSAATCGFCGTPPKIVATLRPTARASGARTAWTWLASSRVGTSTRPRGRQALVKPVGQPGGQRDREAERLAGSGLPPAEDVQAGEGVREGGGLNGEGRGDARRSASAATSGAGTPAEAKVTVGVAAAARAVAAAARGSPTFGGQCGFWAEQS